MHEVVESGRTPALSGSRRVSTGHRPQAPSAIASGLLVLLALALLAGCPPPPPIGGGEADGGSDDADGDGFTADQGDCDDSDPKSYPGANEICGDAKDNNCNKVIDEGCPGGDRGGEHVFPDAGDAGDASQTHPPCTDVGKPCGAPGSLCKVVCDNPENHWGRCGTSEGRIPDTASEVDNCGQCGNVCPTPLHAERACRQGTCTRGPCEKGYFDLDREQTFGCEVQCNGRQCTDGVRTWTLSADPLPESGLVFQTFASGGSFGSQIQTSASHTNMGTLGEPTPPGVGGAVESTSPTHRNIGGFGAALRKE